MAMAKALMTSASDRWFTPPDLLAEIRDFLGGDFYDPCPACLPGEPISSGLWERWKSPVYLNPPYGAVIVPWVRKWLAEPVREGILLVPARTDTRWFAPLFDYPICFIAGRLRFSGASENAPFPSALVYRGPRPTAFARAFRHRGAVVSRAVYSPQTVGLFAAE
jgi:hypothetical protein